MPALLAPSELHAGNAARAAGPLPEDAPSASTSEHLASLRHGHHSYTTLLFLKMAPSFRAGFNIAQYVALGA